MKSLTIVTFVLGQYYDAGINWQKWVTPQIRRYLVTLKTSLYTLCGRQEDGKYVDDIEEGT